MSKFNTYFVQSPKELSPVCFLIAVLLAVSLGCLIRGKSVYAQALTTAQDSSSANTPIAVSSLVNAYAKSRLEKAAVTQEIKVEESNKQTLVAKQSEQ
jgi:hypothetical protein